MKYNNKQHPQAKLKIQDIILLLSINDISIIYILISYF